VFRRCFLVLLVIFVFSADCPMQYPNSACSKRTPYNMAKPMNGTQFLTYLTDSYLRSCCVLSHVQTRARAHARTHTHTHTNTHTHAYTHTHTRTHTHTHTHTHTGCTAKRIPCARITALPSCSLSLMETSSGG